MWTSVKVSFPEEKKHVILFHTELGCLEGFCRYNLHDVTWYKQDGLGLNKGQLVTHWQPMPESPKGEPLKT